MEQVARFLDRVGVALCNMHPQRRNVGLWLRQGWYVAVAHVVGFFVMRSIIGFHPGSAPGGSAPAAAAAASAPSR